MPPFFSSVRARNVPELTRFYALADLSSLAAWSARPLDLFAEAFGRQALCGPAELIISSARLMTCPRRFAWLKEQIELLQAEVRELHYRSFRLGFRNAELEALVAKDSRNSSCSPSTDSSYAKRTQSSVVKRDLNLICLSMTNS
jgi:hypothetical protein